MGDMTVDELKDKKLWFLWSAKPGKNGKVTKVPFAANGGATGTDDAHKGTWVSFDDAESARNQFQAPGLGLKIPKVFFLLDIDHKDISDPFAQLMLSRFSSYAEVSPSGKGIHIIGQCDITKLPVHFDDRRKRLVLDSEYYQKRSDIGLELYIGDITNRYGTFTGNTINSLPIADCTQAVLTTLDKEMRKKPKAKYSAKRDGDKAVFDIVCDLRKQKNGDKFIRLYDKGDFSEYGSQSEADAALCALIAFRTGADPDAIDEVFRSSALYRNKWEKFVHDDVVYCKYYEVVYILFHTGMRISEFCGLTLKDIDLENRTVNIDHQLQRTSDMRYIIETTKTDAGTRVLPITEDVAQMFQVIIEDRNAPKVEKSIDGHSGFLFYDDNGMPLVAMHWQHRFNHMVGRYNDIYRVQMPNITPHVCRHTYCSNMAKSGMNPKTLQYLMGHSDISVTMNVYTHIGFDDAEEELKRLEDFRKAQAEVEKKDEKPMSQKMFKVI